MKTLLIVLTLAIYAHSFVIQDVGDYQQFTYNVTDSQRYARFAAIAFCPKQCVQSWKCETTSKYKLTNLTYIENSVSKAVCYVGYEPSTKSIIISWRGSNNIQNWIEDFNFELIPYEKCKSCFIHTGFMSDYLLNQQKMLTAVHNIVGSYPVEQIINTGHSLGAALSTISGIELALKFPNLKIHVHNFGSPRIGNENLVRFIETKMASVTRVVHNKDIVPHLPPEIEYKHAAYEIFFNAQMINYQICNSSGEDKDCSNKFFPNYDPNDHDFYFVHISQVQCC